MDEVLQCRQQFCQLDRCSGELLRVRRGTFLTCKLGPGELPIVGLEMLTLHSAKGLLLDLDAALRRNRRLPACHLR